jgi:hypothetical protein
VTEAFVREINGQLVLEDPDALAVFKAVNRRNCQNTFDLNLDRIAHFAVRAQNYPRGHAVIVILNMDDRLGSILGDAAMPGQDWDAIRALGQVPFARGLALRTGVTAFMADYDTEAVAQLEAILNTPTDPPNIPVVVIDHGVIAVFPSNLYG